jgi:tetratricopeptide (TPR) repeat protein
VASLIVVSVLALLAAAASFVQYQSQRIDRVRQREKVVQDYKDLLGKGREAKVRQEFPAAKDFLRTAAERENEILDYDPPVEDFHPEARQLLDDVEAAERAHTTLVEDTKKYDRFTGLRDTALFHATLSVGDGLEGNLKATRKAARDALALFGVDPEAEQTSPRVDECIRDREPEVRERCYELLLILAEAEAQPLPGQEAAAPAQANRALRMLELARGFHPETRAYHLRRALYLNQKGDKKAGEKETQVAEKTAPTSALDYYLVGDYEYKQGNVAEAMRSFEGALEHSPGGFFWAQYFLAVCYLRQGEPAQAKHLLTNCLTQHGDLVWIYLMRGFAHGQGGEYDAAERDFNEALKLLKAEPIPQRDALYVLYANRAIMRIRQDKPQKIQEGIDDFQKAIEQKPNEYEPYASLAQVYQLQGRSDLALAQFGEAIRRKGQSADLYRGRARLYEKEKALAKALADSEEAIKLQSQDRGDPDSAQLLARDYAEKGRLLARMQLPKQALAAYNAALKARPRWPPAQLGRAQALRQLRSFTEAVSAYDEYFKHRGRPTGEAYLGRGYAHFNLGHYADAIRDYTVALNLGEDSPLVRTWRGWAYLATNAYSLAWIDFDAWVRAEPENSEAHVFRGYARVKLGDYAQAIADADQAVRNGPLSAPLLYNAARVYAQAAGQVEAEWRQLAYQARSVSLIAQAMARLPAAERSRFWRERIRGDHALDPILQTAGFQRLAAMYGRGVGR